MQQREQDIRLRIESLPALRRQIEDWQSEDYPDEKSIDSAREKEGIWQREEMALELLISLVEKLEQGAIEGEKMSLWQAAKKLFPHSQKVSWGETFRYFGVNGRQQFYAPKVGSGVEVEDVLERFGELCEVGAMEFVEFVNMNPNSKEYRDLKKQLESRGWVWKSVKRKGKVTKVIAIPKG
mgnify:CR=1 FL=1